MPALTLSSLGFNSVPTGGLRMVDIDAGNAESNTWNGSIALGANAAMAVADAQDTLSLGGTGSVRVPIHGRGRGARGGGARCPVPGARRGRGRTSFLRAGHRAPGAGSRLRLISVAQDSDPAALIAQQAG